MPTGRLRADAQAFGRLTGWSYFPVAFAGRLPFQSYTLTTSAATTATILWTDQAAGLQLRVRRGTTVLYSGPVAVSELDLAAAMQPGDTDTLELGVCLPAQAGNACSRLRSPPLA